MKRKGLGLIVVLLAWWSASAARPAFGAAEAEIGKPSPAFAVTALSGDRFDLSQKKGSVVLLAFFATWCDSCQREFPVLNSLFSDLHTKGLDLLVVAADRPRDRKQVILFVKPYGFPAAMLSDADPNGFGSPSLLPILYVVDRAGVIRERLVPSEQGDTKAAILRALSPWIGATGASGTAPSR